MPILNDRQPADPLGPNLLFNHPDNFLVDLLFRHRAIKSVLSEYGDDVLGVLQLKQFNQSGLLFVFLEVYVFF